MTTNEFATELAKKGSSVKIPSILEELMDDEDMDLYIIPATKNKEDNE